MLLHPGNELLQQGFGFLLVPDEVVIDDKRRVEANAAHVVEFGHELVGLFDAGLTPEDNDDVAELALERTAARVLQSPGRIAIDLEEIEPRAGALAMSVGTICL